MNKYQDLTVSIKEIGKPLKKIMWVALACNLIVSGLTAWLVRPTIPSLKPLTSLDVCHQGMRGIFLGSADEELVSKEVMEAAKAMKFQIEDITLIKMIGALNCDVVVKDHKGHRGYQVSLERSSKFEYEYRIADVKGQKLISKYQWSNR